MSDTICPICNGLTNLDKVCEKCGSLMEDHGRYEQLFDPYSPYREIDHIRMTNGFMDVAQHQCIHIAQCPQCSHQQLFFIQEV